MGKNIEELNFLKGELKKINAQIEKLQYGSGVMGSQAKLWELREKIEGKIKECEHEEET